MSKRWSLIRSLRYEIYEREQFAPPLYVFYQNDSANLKVNGRGPLARRDSGRDSAESAYRPEADACQSQTNRI